MAQAARLNLRMQKELKLLATDPPPGVSLPAVSEGTSDSLSLSAIDACIRGPEGTVYEQGVFRIKIQIPERYPFQPPHATFATPIYHPNIDNGGRICLDILNLPPKGAWQPSLNISTVLTSIGLLLTEPNPDDGLMCEASKEYKYNRQLFDQKARSCTQKYAKPGALASTNNEFFLEPNEVKTVITESSSKDQPNEDAGSRKRLCGANRKLSLESRSLSVIQTSANRGNEGSVRRLSLSRFQNLLGASDKPSSLSKTIKADERGSNKDHGESKAPSDNCQRESLVSLTAPSDNCQRESLVSLTAPSDNCQRESLVSLTAPRDNCQRESLVSLTAPSDNCQRESLVSLTVIVSDSEESEEESRVHARSRLSLGRKRYQEK